jgi:hypothetical protein
MKSNYILVILFISILGCRNSTSQSSNNEPVKKIDIYSILSLKSLIGTEISNLKNLKFSNEVLIKDTIFYGEDDEIKWNGLSIRINGSESILIETNWQNISKIQRIGIFNEKITGPSNIHVGSKFSEVKHRFSKTIPVFPDGYFALSDIEYPNIKYFFDIHGYKNLYYGNIVFDNIPSGIKIKEILIE